MLFKKAFLKKAKVGKYKNRKVTDANGQKFDSLLEKYCFDLLNQVKLGFEFQKKIQLQEKTSRDYSFLKELSFFQKDTSLLETGCIRSIYMILDFYLCIGDVHFFIDTKGVATADWKLKRKILESRYIKNGEKIIIFTPHNKAQVKKVVNFLIGIKNGVS